MKNLFNRVNSYALVSALFCAPALCALGPFSAFFGQEWDSGQSFTKQVENHIEDLKKRKRLLLNNKVVLRFRAIVFIKQLRV